MTSAHYLKNVFILIKKLQIHSIDLIKAAAPFNKLNIPLIYIQKMIMTMICYMYALVQI